MIYICEFHAKGSEYVDEIIVDAKNKTEARRKVLKVVQENPKDCFVKLPASKCFAITEVEAIVLDTWKANLIGSAKELRKYARMHGEEFITGNRLESER